MTEFDTTDPVRLLKDWAIDHPLKAHGGGVVAAVGGAWALFPGTLWQWSTAHLFAFGCVHAGGLLAWVIHWEIREEKFTRWLLQPGHAVRWIFVLTRRGAVGVWEYADGQARPRKSATETLDELERRDLEDVAA